MIKSGLNLQNALLNSKASVDEILKAIGEENFEEFMTDWTIWARPDQLPFAKGGNLEHWKTWIVLGGRGAGKTRTGAEWVRYQALGKAPLAQSVAKRIALVGPSLGDARDVMVEGVSGLLGVHPQNERPKFISSKNQLVWPNGSIAQVFSSEDPDSLRGPQFDAAWCDELAKWNNLEQTWDMLQFALRLGENPRAIVTTTPRPVGLLKKLLQDQYSLVTRASTHQNANFLAPGFLARVERLYAGSRLGRQEINGELIEDNPSALFKRDLIDQTRLRKAPDLVRIIVAVDPPVSSHEKSNACGIICAGLGADGHGYVLDDATITMASPMKWAKQAVSLYHKYEADRLVVETNQGGEMATTIIANLDPSVAVKPVHAKRAKHTRAEPLAVLYEQQKIHHVGDFNDLEDEMCAFENTIAGAGASPDRVDALVWALSDLMLAARYANPRVSAL